MWEDLSFSLGVTARIMDLSLGDQTHCAKYSNV
jgi:hypothetical protein